MKEKTCLQCGKCCRHLILKIRVSDKHQREFYRARGFKIKGFDVDVDVPHVCPQLRDDNTCRLHGLHKPYLCQVYPAYLKKKDLLVGCGFK